MTKNNDIIRHLNCAWNLKEQGYTDEAMDEILKALGVLLERDIPRAGERIKSPCLRGQCKKCLIEDGGCKECGSMDGFGGVCRKCSTEKRRNKMCNDIQIKKVKMLGDRAREEANKQNLDENDLVIVRTIIEYGSLPEYELEKIEGSPSIYLQKKYLEYLKWQY